MQSPRITAFQWLIFYLWLLAFISFQVAAQISTDGSVGQAMELAGPNYTIEENFGARADNNLFHSFQDFNINAGETATFTGAPEIERVISRVTGGNLSNIDGLLKSQFPDADFFLVNPAGFIFGPNATVDISGSFHISTADYLGFGENDKFYSHHMENDVLGTEAPTAFGFLDSDIGTITFDRSQIVLEEEQSFSIVGGDITFNNASVEVPSADLWTYGVDFISYF